MVTLKVSVSSSQGPVRWNRIRRPKLLRVGIDLFRPQLVLLPVRTEHSSQYCPFVLIGCDVGANLLKTSSGSGSTTTGSKSTTATGVVDYTTTTSIPTLSSTQPAYPSIAASSCGSWSLVDNVCCPSYCLSDDKSESCTTGCTGGCGTPPSSMCKSGTMCE